MRIQHLYNGLIIGRKVEIAESKDHSLLGRKGMIVDETKNTIVIQETDGRQVRIPKSVVKLRIDRTNEAPLVIAGLDLLASPEERIKN